MRGSGEKPENVDEPLAGEAAGAAAENRDTEAAPDREGGTGEDRLRAEVEEFRDKWLRSAAELDNFRKRTARERQREIRFARDGVVLPLLEVLDDLERALDHEGGGSDDELREGVDMIRQKFLDKLAEVGIEPFSSVGEDFDPEKMEALATISMDDVEPNRVVGEIRKGYRMNDRILRPAQVSVAAAKAEPDRGM